MSQAWNKTGGEQRLFGGGVRIAVLIAGEKIGPQSHKQFFILKMQKGTGESRFLRSDVCHSPR